MSHPERIVPDETEPGIVALHLKRYEFALPYCRGATVLDAGCGVGYGTAHVAQLAQRVVGVDVSDEAIAYAREHYTARNVEFLVADVLELPFDPRSFDTVCSFEIVEHVPDAERFVAELARVLKPGGRLVLSTPRAEDPTVRPDNPFHEREFDADELRRLLTSSFSSVVLFGQRRIETARHRTLRRLDVLGLRRRLPVVRRAAGALTGTAAMDDVALDGIAIERDATADATELVAVCRA
ncbi:MAG TPA: class I SAM-dependent methyltransferase [Gaiellaceae bacterium]|nr:class I SAM-dependent methyltransferase [Gaiellaceae bacterium]